MFYLISLFFIGFNFLYFYLINNNILNPNLIKIFIVLTGIYIFIYAIFFVFCLLVLNIKGRFIKSFFLYLIYIISSALFFIFIRNDSIKIIFYIINVVLTFFNFLSFRSKVAEKDSYFTLETNYFTFLVSVFLFSSSIFSFYVFIGLDRWVVVLMGLVYFFMSYFLIYSTELENKNNISRYIFISSLVSTEIFLALTYLPYSYYVRAILMLIFTFFISNFGKESLQNDVDKKYFRKMFLILMFIVAVVLLTAKII